MDGKDYAINFFKDITEEKQMEEEIARLERLNLIGQMAASIGHEVRNPMTTIKGFLQLFAEKAEFAQYKHYFELMVAELDRANTIITDFLSLSKNKSIERISKNLNEVIKKISLVIQADALKSGVEIKTQLGDIPPLSIDEHEITQLLLNLVRNGIEAMDAGGCLTIGTYLDNDQVVLVVEDEGSGMDQEVMDNIGTPFFTTKSSGTGLGLAVCYSIVSRHEGELDIRTSEKGTTVSVRFNV